MTRYWESNLKQWILEEAAGESIEAIVIGDRDLGEDKIQSKGKVLSWEKAAPLLNYTFNHDSNYTCHAVYAWTPTRVIVIVGNEEGCWLDSIPRFPMECMPSFL